MKKNIEIELSEADWNFVASEVERHNHETDAEVTEAQVITTLIETGICREMTLKESNILQPEIRLLNMLRARTGNNPEGLVVALGAIGQQIMQTGEGADIIRRRLAGICSHCDKPAVDGDVSCEEHGL